MIIGILMDISFAVYSISNTKNVKKIRGLSVGEDVYFDELAGYTRFSSRNPETFDYQEIGNVEVWLKYQRDKDGNIYYKRIDP